MRKKAKFLLAGIPLAVLLLAGSVLGVYAWFQSQETIDNTMKTDYRAELREDFDPPARWTDSRDVTKKAWIVNSGKTDVLVRMHIDEAWTDKDGHPLGNKLLVDGTAVDAALKGYTASMSDDWTAGNDGWLYYRKVLKAGEQTPPFIEKLNLNTDAIDKVGAAAYKDASYRLDFVYESVQARPDDAAASLWKATAVIDGNSVAWSFS